jgi:hypothetical protein
VDSPRRFVIGLMAVSFCVCGGLSLLFLLFGDAEGALWQILTSGVLLGLFSLLAYPGAMLLDLLWAFRTVWGDFHGDDGSWRLLVTLTACATAASQVCATTARRHENDPNAVDRLYGLSTVLVYTLAGMVTLAAWDGLATGTFFWQLLGLVALLDLVAVLLQPVLRQRERVA